MAITTALGTTMTCVVHNVGFNLLVKKNRALITNGADVNFKNKYEMTPLYYAMGMYCLNI